VAEAAPPAAKVLDGVADEKAKHAELHHLPDVHPFVTQNRLELDVGKRPRDPDRPPEGDRNDAARKERTKPPRKADFDFDVRPPAKIIAMRTHRLALVAAAFVAASAFAQQQDFSKVEMKVVHVEGTVYMLQGAGGNIGVSAGDDGIVVVDDEFAPLAPKIKAALKAITDKPIKFIINTHYHGDHTGGNAIFGRDGTIIAQENVRKRLQSGTTAHGRETPPAAKDALPVITFNDRATVHVNGEDIRAVYMPNAHTDGDAVIYFSKSNTVHMGDLFFLGMFPFVDVENGGSVRGMIAGVQKVLATLPEGAHVIPGHGPLASKAALSDYLDVLKGTWAIENEAIQKGKTLDDIKKEKTLEAWSHLASSFVTLEDWETLLYNEITKEAKK